MDSLIKGVLDRENASIPKQELPQKKNKMDEDLREILKSRKAEIIVVGCGGAGNNTLARLVQVGVEGAKTLAVNTDAQDLLYTDADEKILIGKEITEGLGAGANPKVGEAAAKESKDAIKKALDGADMVFVTCGLGGGTGTGSAPVVAEIAKKAGALTVAVVTLPFQMEGWHRAENARVGLENLEKHVDTLIVVPNERLMDIVPDVSINTAFKVADEILVNAVKGVTELVTKPGLINLDFADVRAVMGEGGIAMIGMGQSDTENRAYEAVQKALSNPLLDVEIDGAKGALINVSGGADLTLKEAREVVNTITQKLAPDAKVIWGAMINRELGDALQAMIIVTGVNAPDLTGSMKAQTKRKVEIEEKLGVDFI